MQINVSLVVVGGRLLELLLDLVALGAYQHVKGLGTHLLLRGRVDRLERLRVECRKDLTLFGPRYESALLLQCVLQSLTAQENCVERDLSVTEDAVVLSALVVHIAERAEAGVELLVEGLTLLFEFALLLFFIVDLSLQLILLLRDTFKHLSKLWIVRFNFSHFI